MRRLCFILVLLLFLPSVFALCSDLRLLVTPATASIPVGETLNGELLYSSSPGNIIESTALDGIGNVTIENRSFSFRAENTSANVSRFLFYLVTKEGCVKTALTQYELLHPPEIKDIFPLELTLPMREGRPVLFSANLSSEDTRWFLDGELVGVRSSSFLLSPDYNMAGNHQLLLEVTNEYGLTTNHSWSLDVLNVNRPPIQIVDILGFPIPRGEQLDANLSLYIIDPDGSPLTFSAEVHQPLVADAGTMEVSFNDDLAFIKALSPGKVFISFTATDVLGESFTTEPIAFFVVDSIKQYAPFCGDSLCVSPENCSICGVDCGVCNETPCIPEWVCGEWGECQPTGFQNRSCIIANECEALGEVPPLMQACDYAPSCDDALLNGDELGVDCGGSCEPCPTCTDAVRNQGEERVDCGGPCEPCPSCDDLLKNQAESDVDCGGPCTPCDAGSSCYAPLDCLSFSCLEGICSAAACDDAVRNQGEERVDCGGPCEPCPTCTDALLNQGEERVDCGGPCNVCPSCSDHIVNQDETMIDCGGSCRPCVLNDYFPMIWHYTQLGLIFLFSFFILYLIRSIFASRMIFLFQHGKAIHYFYEDPLTYALLRFWNGIAKHFRVERHKELQGMVEQIYHELTAMKYKVGETALRTAISGKLRALYASLIGLDSGFELEMLVMNVRRSHLPFAVKVIILKNTKMLAMLEKTKLYTDPFYALDDTLKMMEHLRKAF